MVDLFIKPVMLYGIEYMFGVWVLLLVATLACALKRRWVLAVLCTGFLAAALGSVSLYADTVARADDADAAVVRLLWGRAYPGVFALSAEGEPGLPPFVGATVARVREMVPGAPRWMAFSDACLKRVEGRFGEKRRYDVALLDAADGDARCRTFAAMDDAFGVDINALLVREYNALRVYADKVDRADRTAQENCPPFYSDRGRYQKQELNKRTGMMERPYDLSSIKCACVALGRHQGCRALGDRDRTEGYVAQLRQYDFFTPLTCDLSELCTVMRGRVALQNMTPDIAAADKDAAVAQAVERCIATEQFSPERRAALCGCSMRILVGQDARFPRPGPAATLCLRERGFLDEENCVIGEADWNAQRIAVTACVVDGG